jgi:hypothetical protein
VPLAHSRSYFNVVPHLKPLRFQYLLAEVFAPLAADVVNNECHLVSRKLFQFLTDCIVDVRLSGKCNIMGLYGGVY